MVDAESPRLIKFEILYSLVLYADIIMTCWLFGNYEFFYGETDVFINQHIVFYIIVIIQTIHIILNFFHAQYVDLERITNPFIVWKMYLKDQFITDALSTIPWNMLNRKFILLRLLKLRRF